jgi:hypothetical protein
MPAEQALAPPAPLDQALAAIRPVAVPEVWPPDGPVAARTSQAPRSRDGDATGTEPLEPGQPSPRQFALLIVETLAGARPVSQLAPLLSRRGSLHLHRLLPLFSGGLRPRVLRVLTTAPAHDAIEMTVIVAAGRRTRALAVRLERAAVARHAWRDGPAMRWLCTDIEAA